jgi:HEPN domain-containing protein
MTVSLADAENVAGAVVKAIRPRSVVVFGSVATRGEGEDLDLLIVTDEHSDLHANVDIQIHRCLKGFYGRFSIDPFIVPAGRLEEYLRQGSPFLELIAREGRVLYMRGAAREWLEQARDEVKMGKYLGEGGFFKGACFHAQQAMEKAIKALLLAKGWMLERTHSIERLAVIAEQYNVDLPLAEEEIAFMDGIYRGRYPAEAGLLPFGEPSQGDARKAVEIAEKVVAVASRSCGGQESL